MGGNDGVGLGEETVAWGLSGSGGPVVCRFPDVCGGNCGGGVGIFVASAAVLVGAAPTLAGLAGAMASGRLPVTGELASTSCTTTSIRLSKL